MARPRAPKSIQRMKQLQDAGLLSPEEFQHSKTRIMADAVVAQPFRPAPSASPFDELQGLEALHESGARSNVEYDELRWRATEKL